MLFFSSNVVHYTDGFFSVKPPNTTGGLYSWDKPHSVMMHCCLYILLNSVYLDFVKDVCMYVRERH